MEIDYENLFYQKTLKSQTPADLIQEWLSVCELITEGYNDYEPELEHDLPLRDIIENLISDIELRVFNEHKSFTAN